MELAETYDQWERRVRTEGRADVVLRLLARKFGALGADVVARVRAAAPDELDRFADRVLDAASIAEVVA